MTTLFQAARVALEALDSDNPDIQLRAATALRAALAQSAPEPQHKPGCALLKIPARECDCGAEPVATFDEVWDAIDWDKWRMEPVRELVRMIHSKTSPKAALAQSEQEPVQKPYCYVYEYDGVFGLHREFYPRVYNGREPDRSVPLYTAPPQQPAPEPVAWIHTDPDKPRVKFLEWGEDEPGYRGRWIKTPLYTRPDAAEGEMK